MEQISLRFQAKHELLDFLNLANEFYCQVDLDELTLASSFSAEQVALAAQCYQAEVLVECLVY